MILRSMRSGFFSKAFLGLLVLGGASLVFTDWNGMFRGGGINKTDIAKVDGTPIKIAEFNSRVNNILRNQQVDAETAYKLGLITNILSNEVYDLQIKKNALDLGIRVEDRIVAEQIKQLIAPLKKDGMDDKAALKHFLEMQGLSEQQLVASLRDELTSNVLKSALSSGSYAPESLINDYMAYKNQTRNIDIAFYPNAAIVIKDTPKDEDLQKFYESLASDFMVAEKRDITIALLDASKIGTATVSDEEVKTAYDENQDSFTIPEQVEIEQTLLSDEAQAKKLVETAKGGKSIKEATQSVTGSDKAYQGQDSFAKDSLPASITEPVLAAKAGDIVGPIKSPLGYHVIKLVKISPAHPADFASVKDKIRKELEEEKSANALFDLTGKLEDRLANGEKFEDMSKDFSLELRTLKGLSAKDKAPESLSFAGDSRESVMKKIFTAQEGQASALTEIGNHLLFSVRLDKLHPAAPKPFAEVKGEVLKKWTAQNQLQNNLLATQKLVDELNGGKADKAALKARNIVDFSATTNKDIAKDAATSIMAAESGKFIMAISREKDGIYVAKVNSVKLDQAAPDKSNEARKQMEADMSNAAYMTYLDSLQSSYPATINSDLLERVYGKSTVTE